VTVNYAVAQRKEGQSLGNNESSNDLSLRASLVCPSLLPPIAKPQSQRLTKSNIRSRWQRLF
jgi:hypothetical protein